MKWSDSKQVCSVNIILAVFFFLLQNNLIAQSYPGGVVNAELWYKAENDNDSNFIDHSDNKIEVGQCDSNEMSLFNFNPSYYGTDLCFTNILPLERSVSRSQFIVADVNSHQKNYALTTTTFNDFVIHPARDSSSINTYVIHTKDAYASKLNSDMTTQENAAIYASNWDQYAQTFKFKQYGLQGESFNHIGKMLPSDFIDRPDADFSGFIPEFIYYDRALSKNAGNKVASYLGLKYGITLEKRMDYLDSKSQKFWNKENNSHFPNRIFGVGKDVLSDLYQSQSESRHSQDYLVFAIKNIYPKNDHNIINEFFNDREFIVIGDTGGSGFSTFQENMKKHKRTWLVQLSGQDFVNNPNHLRVNLDMLLDPSSTEYQEVLDKKLELRLLHDPYATNTSVSDFAHSEVNYIEPSSVTSGTNGELYAEFENLLELDENLSKYHQFTFVLVDEVAIKFKPIYECDRAALESIDCYSVAILIEEGQVAEIEITSFEGGRIPIQPDYDLTQEYGKPVYTFEGCAGIYEITLRTRSGREFTYTYELESKGPYHVDLGPSVQYLDGNQQEIELNANGNINDPDATFRWYKDSVLTEHTSETLMVDTAGEYCLEVTTGDKVCRYMYCTRVEARMSATIHCEQSSCSRDMGKVYVEIDNGIPPFFTAISSNNGFYQEYYHETDLIIDELPNGSYTITVEDNEGNIESSSCMIETSGGATFSSFDISNTILSSSNASILLNTQDSTDDFGSYTYHYQWYLDEGVLPDTTPSLLAILPGEYKVEIYIEELDCMGVITQNIKYNPACSIHSITACESFANAIEITFDYGFPPYKTQIEGTITEDGTNYNQIYTHNGNIEIADIPYGEYTVRTEDKYEEYCERNITFVDTFKEEILLEKIIESNGVMAFCDLKDPYNGYEQYLCSCCGNGVFKYIYEGGTYPATLIDASTNLNNPQDFSFEWFKDGVSLGIYDAEVILAQWYHPVEGGVEGEPEILHEFKVIATHEMGCSIESGFLAEDHFKILPYIPSNVVPSSIEYETRVYPNPNTSGATFYYHIQTDAAEAFEGEVELITMTGAVVAKQKIRGNTSYTLPFQLITTGTYLIRTTTKEGEVLIDRILVK